MDHEETETLRTLDSLVSRIQARKDINGIALRLEQDLAADADAVMKWEPIPLSAYGENLPAEIQSSWVFVLRARTVTVLSAARTRPSRSDGFPSPLTSGIKA